MNIKFSPPDITEREVELVVNALKSGWITTGPKTKEFEKKIAEYVGCNKAVALNSATAGLELILRILGVGPGDEVITSAYTYTASASVIYHVGAKIVLCDTAKDSYEMDYNQLAKLVTNKTKAIISVDIAGIICDYEKIYKIVEDKKDLFIPSNDLQTKNGQIFVIADAAHSFGAVKNGIKSGLHADFTSFSFHAVKNLTTAEGGAVVWNHRFDNISDQLYADFMLWSLHGQNKDALAKTKVGAWEYDIKILGYKCNMTDILASLGLAQLERYDNMLARRQEIIRRYDCAFMKYANLLQHKTSKAISSGHLYLTRFYNIDSEERRNRVIEKLAQKGIATNVHYKPLPMHSAYKELEFDIKNYPNAYQQYKNEITLPLHTLLKDDEISYIIESVGEIINGK